MTRYPEQDAVISGIGISDIGRKTGTPGIELTMQSVTAAFGYFSAPACQWCRPPK